MTNQASFIRPDSPAGLAAVSSDPLSPLGVHKLPDVIELAADVSSGLVTLPAKSAEAVADAILSGSITGGQKRNEVVVWLQDTDKL
ncbi:unnamed protein product [Protopolystoma xenopodis]|uniref:Uncharacterized protein n=1 Tax=Protopolystoma xenopodis TaxID=117903 RepID=A0A448X5B0_9PLAT|nr:unnamed protein product [Protopolystoma xenopodis]